MRVARCVNGQGVAPAMGRTHGDSSGGERRVQLEPRRPRCLRDQIPQVTRPFKQSHFPFHFSVHSPPQANPS